MASDRRSQRHTSRARFNIRREAITKKHTGLLFDDDIDDSHFKENVKQTPLACAASPSVKPGRATSPSMKPARATSPRVTSPKCVFELPATATWGMKAKLQRSVEWVSKRDREILDEAHSAETLPSKARLRTKSSDAYGCAYRKEKIKQRSLRRKYWIKSDKARRAARKQHALAAAQQPEAEPEPEPEMGRVDVEEHADGEYDGGGTGGGGVGEGKKAPRVRQSAYWTKRHEKTRRQARCAARDRKCFDPTDPVESIRLEPIVDEAPKKKKRSFRRAVPRAVLKPELLRSLLSRESAGPPVTDLLTTGVVLSNEAVYDLQLMLAGQGVARALAKAVSAPPLKIRSAKEVKAATSFKTPPPAKAHPTKPALVGPRGKRCC